MSDALSLIVKFAAIDKLSGGIKTIVTAGKAGSASMMALQKEIRAMEKDLARVNRQMARGGASSGGLSMAQRELTEAIERSNAELETQSKRIARIDKISEIGEKIQNVGETVSVAVGLPMAAFAATAIQASRDASAAQAQVAASLASMGALAGRNMEQLQVQATALMNQSLFDDDEIMRSVTANMLTFGKVSGATFDAAQRAAIDLSTKLGTDLQSSTLMVGKALNDPIKGITALTRSGVSFTAQQKAMIEKMVEVGNVAGAQKLILSELDKQFGGSAKAARTADPATAAKLKFGELQQAVGDKLVPALMPLLEMFSSLLDSFNNLSPATHENDCHDRHACGRHRPSPDRVWLGHVCRRIDHRHCPGAGRGIYPDDRADRPHRYGARRRGLRGLQQLGQDQGSVHGRRGMGKSVFGGLPGWLKSIGSMMMQGLLMALNPALLVARLINVAKVGIAAFKAHLGIKSPSRLFMEMGGHMTEGLGMGIDRGGRRPLQSIGRLAAGVAGAGAMVMAPAASARAPGGGATPVTIHIHQLPGEDSKALAARVADELERRQQRSRLGSYRDDF